MLSRNPTFIKVIQLISWAFTFVFLVFLATAIFQAIVNGDPMPLWAWLGLLVVLAVVAGLAILYVVYRSMGKAGGGLAYAPSTRVTGELRNASKQVEAGGASSLRAEIRMAEGILHLQAGATSALDAAFAYDDADWKPPAVEYAVSDAGEGNLRVRQQRTNRPAMRQGRNEWTLRLNQELPTDLDVHFGAGKALLDLSALNLTGLRVDSGLGELTVDLSGYRQRNLKAAIKLGIGDTLLRVPRNAGVRVQSAVSLGSTDPEGLTWDGEAYTNALYAQGGPALDINVSGGMGKLTIEEAG